MQSKISDNKRIIALILILLIITIASGLSATMVLYKTALKNTRQNLRDTVSMQVSTIETLHQQKGAHKHTSFFIEDHDILDLFVDVIKHYRQTGEAIEIDIASHRGDEVVFLYPSGRGTRQISGSQSGSSPEPMLLALSGQTGTTMGKDLTGNRVLAAYEYSTELALGVVAKVKVEKIQQPFIQAGYIVMIISVVMVVIGVYISFRVGAPIIRKMRDNEQRFRSLFNESTYFVALLSADGRVEMLNDTALECFHLNDSDYLDKPIDQLPLWAHSEQVQVKVHQAISKLSPGSIVRYGTSCVLPDGHIIDIDFSIKPVTDIDNNIVNIIAEGNDISELMKTQKNLQESQQRYQSLVESSGATLWEMDVNLEQFIYVGGQALQLLGYPVHQWYEKNFWTKHIHPDDLDEVQSFCHKAISKEGHYDHQFRMVSQQGETVWIHNYINVLYSDTNVSSLTGYMFNITEQMEYEQQFQRSQKMEALGQVTGGIAHDYNNMLGIIMGYSNILMSKLNDQPALLKYAERINEAGQRNAKLTQKLLAFSSDKTQEAEKLNINDILEEMQHLLEKTLTSRINLVVELSDALWDVKLDKGDFVDAVLNMSINAMHAMENGGQLNLTTENVILDEAEANILQVHAGDYVMLSVKDTGTGIDEYIQSKMFDPFFSTKGKNGSGLGLSQVYSFLKKLGGAIKVSSEIGKGSCFFIYIPRHSSEEEQEKIEQEIAQHTRGEEAILVVDDEPMLAEMTGEHLKVRGYKVIFAENGQQALDILGKQSIDLMLSDVIMPGMDGYQLAVRVKELYPEVKIQLVTGYSDGKHLDQNNKLVDPVLYKNIIYKPFEINDLLKKIRALLDDSENISDLKKHPHSHSLELGAQVQWQDKLKTGFRDLDSQHKYLFELFDHFEQAIKQNDRDLLENNFKNLIKYINAHFQREEQFMLACGFQGYNKHQQMHELFKKQVLDYFDDFNKDRLNMQAMLSVFRNWLDVHVAGMDQAFGFFCKDKQKEINKRLENYESSLLTREQQYD